MTFCLVTKNNFFPTPYPYDEKKEMERERRENKQSRKEGMRGLPGMFFKGMRSKTSDKREVEKDNKKPIKMTKMKKRESEGRASHFDDERKKGEVQYGNIFTLHLSLFLPFSFFYII